MNSSALWIYLGGAVRSTHAFAASAQCSVPPVVVKHARMVSVPRPALELVDIDPTDPFDFSVDRWNDQLVAGYSKTTTARGLKAHMPDYNDLKARRK